MRYSRNYALFLDALFNRSCHLTAQMCLCGILHNTCITFALFSCATQHLLLLLLSLIDASPRSTSSSELIRKYGWPLLAHKSPVPDVPPLPASAGPLGISCLHRRTENWFLMTKVWPSQ